MMRGGDDFIRKTISASDPAGAYQGSAQTPERKSSLRLKRGVTMDLASGMIEKR